MVTWLNQFRFYLTLFFILVFLVAIFALLPICETKIADGQGVITCRTTLFAKIWDFLEREQNFRRIVVEITHNQHTDEEKILAIYEWVRTNIKVIPSGWESLPESHELNILIHRYATNEDRARIFCILTTFAGYPGMRYHSVLNYNPETEAGMVSIINLSGRWLYLDLTNNIYFTYKGGLTSIEDIKEHPEELIANGGGHIKDRTYFIESAKYLKDVELKSPYFTRGDLQMLFPRIQYEILKLFIKRGILYDLY